MSDQAKFVDMPRAAEVLFTTRYVIRRLIKNGEIEAHQLGKRGRWRISRASLAECLDRVKDRYGSSPVHSRKSAQKSAAESLDLQDRFLTSGEAATILDVTECTVLWLIKRGKFKAYQNGKGCSWRIDRGSFDAWNKMRIATEEIETPNLWMTTTEAADMLKISDTTVRKFIRDGLLVSNQRNGRSWKWVSRRSVEELIESWMEQAKGRRSLAASAQ